MTESFEEFWLKRVHASNQFLLGNPDPLTAITARQGQVLLYDPRGLVHIGFADVVAANMRASRRFDGVSLNDFESHRAYHDQDFAYWIGIQRSRARLVETGEWVDYNQRMIEHYQREEDSWKWSLRAVSNLVSG